MENMHPKAELWPTSPEARQNPSPGRKLLARTLLAQMEYRRMRKIRTILVHLLAAISAAVWVVAVWPALLSHPLRPTVLMGWGVLCLMTATAVAWEIVWRRRRAAVLKAVNPQLHWTH